MKRLFRLTLIVLLLAVPLLSTAGCRSSEAGHEVAMAPLAGMPDGVQDAPVLVQEAYQFAVANPEPLKQIPCYCGCGAMGHTSIYSCYVAEKQADGTIVYDDHALFCGICVDIAHDSKRMMSEGKNVDEIFTYIDNSYGRFGPPTPLE